MAPPAGSLDEAKANLPSAPVTASVAPVALALTMAPASGSPCPPTTVPVTVAAGWPCAMAAAMQATASNCKITVLSILMDYGCVTW